MQGGAQIWASKTECSHKASVDSVFGLSVKLKPEV